MKRTLMLTGDVNLMNVTDPQVPFARITDTLRQADVLFGNLECCFYEPATGHSVEREGFYAPLASAEGLVIGGFRSGRTKEAVKDLLQLLDQPRRRAAFENIGYCNLLCHYVTQAEARGVQLPPAIVDRARESLRRHIPLLMRACGGALKKGNIVQARSRGLDTAVGAHPGRPGPCVSAPALAPQEPLPACCLSGRPQRRQSPAEVWAMAMHTERGDDAPPNRYSLAHALHWQMKARRFDGWTERLLQTAEIFPEDRYIWALPARACDTWGSQVSAELVDVLNSAAATGSRFEWMLTALDRMGPDFFADAAVLGRVAEMLAQSGGTDAVHRDRMRRLAKRVVEGLASWQIDARE